MDAGFVAGCGHGAMLQNPSAGLRDWIGLDSEEGVEALAPVEGVAVIDDEVAARGGFVGGDAGEVG